MVGDHPTQMWRTIFQAIPLQEYWLNDAGAPEGTLQDGALRS